MLLPRRVQPLLALSTITSGKSAWYAKLERSVPGKSKVQCCCHAECNRFSLLVQLLLENLRGLQNWSVACLERVKCSAAATQSATAFRSEYSYFWKICVVFKTGARVPGESKVQCCCHAACNCSSLQGSCGRPCRSGMGMHAIRCTCAQYNKVLCSSLKLPAVLHC